MLRTAANRRRLTHSAKAQHRARPSTLLTPWHAAAFSVLCFVPTQKSPVNFKHTKLKTAPESRSGRARNASQVQPGRTYRPARPAGDPEETKKQTQRKQKVLNNRGETQEKIKAHKPGTEQSPLSLTTGPAQKNSPLPLRPNQFP